jgi:hypothetical protein
MSRRQRWVLVLTSIASLMVALDVTVVSTALSSIRLHLDASIDQLEWTVNAYGLSFAVLLMTGAASGDRFGRRRIFAESSVASPDWRSLRDQLSAARSRRDSRGRDLLVERGNRTGRHPAGGRADGRELRSQGVA